MSPVDVMVTLDSSSVYVRQQQQQQDVSGVVSARGSTDTTITNDCTNQKCSSNNHPNPGKVLKQQQRTHQSVKLFRSSSVPVVPLQGCGGCPWQRSQSLRPSMQASEPQLVSHILDGILEKRRQAITSRKKSL